MPPDKEGSWDPNAHNIPRDYPGPSEPNLARKFLTWARHTMLRRQARKRGGGFSRLEYLEMNSEEMKKFKNLPQITSLEIDNVDWDELLSQLTA